MKIAIHQPNFLPWTGYFYKMANSDIFVFLDNVQYEKNSVINRNKIKISQGLFWITLPIRKKNSQLINETELLNFSREKERIIKTLKLNYQKAKYFDFIFPELENILEKDWQYLSELNIELIKFLKRKIGIKTKLEIVSGHGVLGEKTDLLINICKFFDADTYLSGEGGREYQDEEKFKIAKIKLEYSNFVYPVYPQQWGKFAPNLSIVDLLFNCGPDSLKILLGE